MSVVRHIAAVFGFAVASLALGQTQAVDVAFTTPANGYNVGDSVTTTMLGYAIRSTGLTSSYSGTAGALTLNASIAQEPYYKYKVGGSVYDLSSAQGWQVSHASSSNVVQLAGISQSGTVSAAYLMYTNVDQNDWQGAHQRIDYSVLTGNTGSSAYDNYQIYSSATTPRGHHIETDAGDTVVPAVPYHVYHVTIMYTPGNPGIAKESIYDPSDKWRFLGESSRSAPNAATINGAHFGSDAGTSNFAGKVTYFKAVVVDLSGKYPLGVPEQPSAPTGLAAGTPTGSTIPLTWTPADTKEQTFEVYRSWDNSVWTLVACTAAEATGYTDTNLTPGRTAYYKVRAHNISYDSGFTSTVNATTSGVLPSTQPEVQGLLVTAP